jgi:hypothetical protein
MIKKCDSWPVVLPNDDGIRPAGEPDECFYCRSKVGQKHEAECVTVSSYNLYRVLTKGSKKLVGVYKHYDPYFWTFQECEFHKNESTYCKDNALNGIDWCDSKDAEELERRLMEEDRCSCGLLTFEFMETIDAGPFIELRESE